MTVFGRINKEHKTLNERRMEIKVKEELSDYKHLYEDTLRRLIIGKTCLDEYDDVYDGAMSHAAQFYVDLLMPDGEENFSKKYRKGIGE